MQNKLLKAVLVDVKTLDQLRLEITYRKQKYWDKRQYDEK